MILVQRLVHFLSRIGAALIVLAVLIGPVVLMAAISGNPFDSSVIDSLGDRQVDNTTVLKLLSIGFYVLWAWFSLPALRQAQQSLTSPATTTASAGYGGRHQAIALPIEEAGPRGWLASLVRYALTTATIAATMSTMPAGGLVATAVAPAPTTVVVDTASASSVSSTARDTSESVSEVTAQRRDTPYSIARRLFPESIDDARDQILELNTGRSTPTGSVWSGGSFPVGMNVITPFIDTDGDDESTAVPLHADVTTGSGQATSTDLVAATDVKQYTVQSNDGMWNVAEALLGDGSRHAELQDLMVGQEVAPGVVFTADDFVIHEGWVFTLADQDAAPDAETPTTALVETHTVVAGDTLSEIAEQQLGDADAWPEIFEENAGRQMNDGRTFDDPNLILPGWQIDVPTDDPVVAEVDVQTPVEIPATGTPAPVETPAAAEPLPAPPTDTGIPPAVQEAVSDPDAVGTDIPVPEALPVLPAPTTTPTTALPAPTGDGAGSDIGDERPDSPAAPSPIRIEHAALLAAGVLALVSVRRRQRLRAAAPRARVPEPPPTVVATERRLRTIDAGERSLRVDVAIRAAAHELVDTDAQIGTVLVDHDGEIEIRLTSPADLQSPWVAVGDDQQSWGLPAALPIELLGEAARRVGTPCVALVQLGVSADRDVLIDIEACGTLAVDARAEQATEVLNALAAGLATSPYAEIAHLITVSLADAAVLGHRNAHRATTPGHAFELAASLIGSTNSAERSTFSLRSLRTGGEMWEPAVILLRSTEGQQADFPSRLPLPGRGVGLIAATGPAGLQSAGARLVGSSNGWRFDAFGTSIDLTPVGIDAVELAAVAELIDDASAPLAIDDEITWAASDNSGSGDEQVALREAAGTVDPSSDVPQPVENTAVFEPRGHSIMVRLMGGVEVVSHDDRPGSFERSKTVELIAWLATHRSSSTRGAARTALWELDVRDATFANVVSEARRALARLVTPLGDDEWVGRTLTEHLPLHNGVVTDADLIHERLTAARLQPPAQAIETLTPAAELIRNIPFAGTSYLWPDAEGITSNLVLLATGVSTELAGHALSLGDTDLVFWATGQGLKVLPGHEELIGLRMQAHARAGDLAGVRQEWESYERVIVADAWSDGEPAPKLLALRHELLTSPA